MTEEAHAVILLLSTIMSYVIGGITGAGLMYTLGG